MSDSAVDMVEKIETSKVPWLPYGLIEGSSLRVLKVDLANNIVVLNFRMGPGTVTQMHGHHCTATAYTLSGEWSYDGQVFRQGDIAYEPAGGKAHQPVTRDKPAELLTTLIGGPGNTRLLQNYEEDGSTYILGTRLFAALEGLTPEAMADIDLMSLVDPA